MKEGRVQVCRGGQWHSLCADSWSSSRAEAGVVCSGLGFSGDTGYIVHNCERFTVCCDFLTVIAEFGRDSNPILPLDFQCNGSETTLLACNVTHRSSMECREVAGVICEGKMP